MDGPQGFSVNAVANARVVSEFAGRVSDNLAQVYLYGIGDADIALFFSDLLEDRGVLEEPVVGRLEFGL